MRVRVSAASRHDATFEVAQAIAKTLERADIEVDVRGPEEVGPLAAYDGVVLAEGDYRPWDEIEAWAEEIATTLKAAVPTDQPV